jgi:hypothetical protein
VTEQGASALAAYDPLGNYVTYSPPQGPPPQVQAPGYFGAWSSFTNAYNYSTGCTWDGAPTDCNTVVRSLQHSGDNGISVERSTITPGSPSPGGGVWAPVYGRACVTSEDAHGVHTTCEPYVAGYDWQGGMGQAGFALRPGAQELNISKSEY